MPFKSKAQERAAEGGYLGPKMKAHANLWAKHTPDLKDLPEHVEKKAAALLEAFTHLQKVAAGIASDPFVATPTITTPGASTEYLGGASSPFPPVPTAPPAVEAGTPSLQVGLANSMANQAQQPTVAPVPGVSRPATPPVPGMPQPVTASVPGMPQFDRGEFPTPQQLGGSPATAFSPMLGEKPDYYKGMLRSLANFDTSSGSSAPRTTLDPNTPAPTVPGVAPPARNTGRPSWASGPWSCRCSSSRRPRRPC